MNNDYASLLLVADLFAPRYPAANLGGTAPGR